MAGSDWRERLSPDRLKEMEPHERVVYYELILLPGLRDQGFNLEEARASVNLGMAYLESYRVDEAIHYLAGAVQILESNADHEGLAKALVDIGVAWRYKSEPGEAFSAYHRAFEMARQLALPEVIGSSVRNLTVLLDEQHLGTDHIDLCLAMEEQTNRFRMTDLACDAARLLGVELLEHHQHEAAKQALARSLRLAQDLGWLQVRRELLELAESGGYAAYSERLFAEAQGYMAAGWPRLAAAVFNKILVFPGADQEGLQRRIIRVYLAADQRAEAEALARQTSTEG